MGEGLRMVHLRTVPDAWHAKVLAARLGADGILTEVRGPVPGLYPFGAVSVYVEQAQAELASQLLLADEVEAAFSPQLTSRLSGSHWGTDDILPHDGDGGRWHKHRRYDRSSHRDDLEVVFGLGDDVDLRAFDGRALFTGDDDAGDGAGPDDLWEGPALGHHRLASRKRRALAAFAALMVAGAPVLAHFVA